MAGPSGSVRGPAPRSLGEAQVGAFAAEQQVRYAPLPGIPEVPGVSNIRGFQADAPLAAHDQVAGSFSRIFYDAGRYGARRAFLIDAGNRAPLHAAFALAEYVGHDTGRRAALKDLAVQRLAIGILRDLQKDRHRRSL